MITIEYWLLSLIIFASLCIGAVIGLFAVCLCRVSCECSQNEDFNTPRVLLAPEKGDVTATVLVMNTLLDARVKHPRIWGSAHEGYAVILEELDIAQSTLSHHMKILCESGIVGNRKEGKWTYYFISNDGTGHAKDLLAELTTPTDVCECKGDCLCK